MSDCFVLVSGIVWENTTKPAEQPKTPGWWSSTGVIQYSFKSPDLSMTAKVYGGQLKTIMKQFYIEQLKGIIVAKMQGL